jgi:hypothetical protein
MPTATRFHVTPRQPAVGVQPFVDYHQVAQFIEQVGIVDRHPSADVHQAILLGAHPRAVGVGAELLQDGGNRRLRVPFFALLDEEGVFDHARRVEEDADAVPVAQCAQRPHIRHTHRLPASHVHRAARLT